jgi:hypothetical protein
LAAAPPPPRRHTAAALQDQSLIVHDRSANLSPFFTKD